MNPALQAFFGWLLRASAQAAIITALVLLAQICLRKHLDARWRHLLWLVVLARLAMPVALPSPTSLFNVVRVEPTAISVRSPASTVEVAAIATAVPEPNRNAVPATAITLAEETATVSVSPASSRLPQPGGPRGIHWGREQWGRVLAGIWALGVAALGLRATVQNLRFVRRLRCGRLVTDPPTLELLRDCKALMGGRAAVALVETEAVKSPALYGLFRLRLLLPAGLIENFTTAELRHVLLHELAHVRRRDMLMQWVVMAFQMVHWFNPVLWLGFRKMAADRELACDDLALSVAGEGEGQAYGRTIVKLLEACSQPPALPALVGILEDKAQMFQRITMIARFKQHSRWSLAGMVAAMVLALATLTGAQTKPVAEKGGVTLTGRVQLPNGEPADATVCLYTAGPKSGTSPVCPSCYPDCRKRAKTDKQGNFKIESLNPELIFRLLVVGKGEQPLFVSDVDPAKAPVRVTLQPRPAASVGEDQGIRGRIVDSRGEPIPFAAISGQRVVFRDGKDGNPGQDIEPLAVSDERGEFILAARRPLVSLTLQVEAPGYAKRKFPNLVPGQARDFGLTEGAMVQGRVLMNGKPLPNVLVGIVSADRTIDNYTGEYEVGTDTNGTFLFRNLPPNVDYQLWGAAKSLHTFGATKALNVGAGGDGTVTQAGDLLVEHGLHVSGRVILADGQPIPAKSRISIGRNRGSWDAQLVELGSDGIFNVDGVPTGTVCIAPRVNGYRPSVKNESLDSLNPFWLLGRLDQDISGLVVLMEKGKRLNSFFNNGANGMALPENRPLTGAERADDHSRDRAISGVVNDKETGRPIAGFELTLGNPGRSGSLDPNDMEWNPQRRVTGTNGTFILYVPKETDRVALMVEASGYLPVASPLLAVDRTNFDFALTKGQGPSGVVLSPDGKPVAGASVALLRPMGQAAVQLRGRGKFESSQHPEWVVAADAGHFALPAALGMDSVAVCAQAGFKVVSLTALAANEQITLEPWGKVQGTIRRGGHPSAGEKLFLSFSGSLKDKSLGMFFPTATDGQGNFEFDFAPPTDCRIFAETPTGDMPAALTEEKEFQVQAGQTAKLVIEAAEKPAVDLARARQRARNQNEIPSKRLKGSVVSPDGKPVANVQVGIADEDHSLRIGDGQLVAGLLNPNIARTDEHGAFEVPWPSSATTLCVANAEGVASVSMGTATNGIRVVLQPWASVEGVMRRDGRPDAGAKVHLHEITGFGNGQAFQADATADANGHFDIRRVLPGVCGLGRWTDLGGGSRTMAELMQFELAPGASTNLICGGNGRPLTGTFTFEEGVPTNVVFHVTLYTPIAPPQEPGHTNRPTSAEYRKWRQSPEGKLAAAAYRAYSGQIAGDHSFHVDDVPPGNYEIFIHPRFNADLTMGECVPSNIMVPPVAEPNKGEAYDLGRIQVTPIRIRHNHNPNVVIKVGNVAPEISTTTYEGKPLRLSDYRGKYVLLDFRSMLPGREMDSLRAVNDAFGKEDRLVTISLALNADDNYVKQLADRSPHWIVGDLDYSKLAESYGLDSTAFPNIFLMGPDGKIVATHLTGDGIIAAVAQALAKK